MAIKNLEEELDVKLSERGGSEDGAGAAIKEIAKRGKDPVSGPLRLAPSTRASPATPTRRVVLA